MRKFVYVLIFLAFISLLIPDKFIQNTCQNIYEKFFIKEPLDKSKDKSTKEDIKKELKKEHRYELCIDDVSWTEAYEGAKQKGGYLAEIESKEEYEKVLKEINSNKHNLHYIWLGAKRNSDNKKYMRWVNSGNKLTFEMWHSKEPSYVDGDIPENYLCMMIYANEDKWTWNDVPNDIIKNLPSAKGKIGYIVEYDK